MGKLTGHPTLVGASIVIEVFSDKSILPYSMDSFFQDLQATEDELKRNASLEKPLPHAVAVTKPLLVKVLRALEVGYNNFGTEVLLETASEKRSLPVCAPADFTEPERDENKRKADTFSIVGLRRDDVNGHCLIVTDNDLFVRLPRDDPEWVWVNIFDVLEGSSWLEGSLVRESKGHAWKLGADAKLVKQPRVDKSNDGLSIAA